MAEQAGIIRRYYDFLGLDLRSNPALRKAPFSSGMSNADIDENDGDLRRRLGTKIRAIHTEEDPISLMNFTGLDLSNEETFEIVTPSQKINGGAIVFAYDPGSVEAYRVFSIFWDDVGSEYVAQITESDGTILQTVSLGTGLEVTPVSVDDMRTAINAGGFGSITYTFPTGLENRPAAFLKNCEVTSGRSLEQSSGLYFQYKGNVPVLEFEDLDRITTLGNGLVSTWTNLNDVLYFVEKDDFVKKYDGSRVFLAGIEKPDTTNFSLTAKNGAFGGITTDIYTYRFRYVSIDHAGNVVRSQISKTKSVFVDNGASNDAVDVQVPAPPSSQYRNMVSAEMTPGTVPKATAETGDAVVLNFQPGENLSSFKVGEKIWWTPAPSPDALGVIINGNVSSWAGVEHVAEITNVDNVGKTISGTYTKDVNGDGIVEQNPTPHFASSQFYAEVYRTKGDATDPSRSIFYLVGRVALGDANSTFEDRISNSEIDLNPVLLDVEFEDQNSPPPKGAILSQYEQRLLVAQVDGLPNTVEFSNSGFPESFDKAENSFRVDDDKSGDVITGLGTSEDHFLVLKDRSALRVTGTLEGGAFRVDKISNTTGCTSPRSVIEWEDGRIAWMSHEGPYESIRGQDVVPIGAVQTASGELSSRIKPIFESLETLNQQSANPLDLSAAIAVNWPKGHKLIFFVPAVPRSHEYEGVGIAPAVTADSKCYVYDYVNGGWFIWDGLNMAGGAISVNSGNMDFNTDALEHLGLIKDELFFLEFFTTAGIVGPYDVALRTFNLCDRPVDQNDDGAIIPFRYQTHWEHLDSPEKLKKYNKLSIMNFKNGLDYSMTVNQYVDFDDQNSQSEMDYDFAQALDSDYVNRPARKSNKSVMFEFTNNVINEKINISGWSIEMTDPNEERTRN